MRDPARVVLDDVSDHLGEVLRRADRLLAEWSAFGTKVRDEVDRETRAIGHAVATSVDQAVRGVAEAAITQQLETRLAALTAELARLEQRSRAASQALREERASQRRVGWIAVAGIVLANVLLGLLLLRGSAAPSAPAVAPAVAPSVTPAAGADAGIVGDATSPSVDATGSAGSADTAAVGMGSGSGSGAAAPTATPTALPVPTKPAGAKRGTLPSRRN